jgi:hypothetical protein
MAIKGELFSTDMVKAFLEGRKTRTSRPLPKGAEVREWVSCEVRTCPHNGRQICRYCCMKCKYSSNAGEDCNYTKKE